MTDPIHVAFCIDRIMLKPLAAAILSLAASARSPLHIHACVGPDAEAAAALAPLLTATGCAFDVNTAAPETADALPFISPYGRRSTATYRRSYLDTLYPELDRIVFIDADTMIRRDLAPLWQADLGGRPVGAVRDPWWMTDPAREALFPGGYFNGGLLLLDLAAWRTQGLAARLADYVRAWKSGNRIGLAGDAAALANIWGFQNEMNAALAGLWTPLPAEWNASLFHHSSKLPQTASIARARNDPGIVHFMGHEKPWDDIFAALSDSHAEYQPWRQAADAALPQFAWPGAYVAGREKKQAQAMAALTLIAHAREAGVRRAVLIGGVQPIATTLPIAAKAGIAIAALISQAPGPLRRIAGLDFVTPDAALQAGEDTFLIASENGVLADALAAQARAHGTFATIVSMAGVHGQQPRA